jgi:hypothetical protein
VQALTKCIRQLLNGFEGSLFSELKVLPRVRCSPCSILFASSMMDI